MSKDEKTLYIALGILSLILIAPYLGLRLSGSTQSSSASSSAQTSSPKRGYTAPSRPRTTGRTAPKQKTTSRSESELRDIEQLLGR